MTTTGLLTIGRQTQTGRTLSIDRWTEFQSSLADRLRSTIPDLILLGLTTGVGEYGGEREECAYLLFTTHTRPDAYEFASLRNRLSELAADYDQHSIGLLLTTDETLILADPS